MAIGIATNIASLRATNDLSQINLDNAARRGRLTSGLAINSSREGSTQLYVTEGMRAQISGKTQGTRNAENTLDLLRTAEGSMNEISSVLIRMREMAVQSSAGTLNDRNRELLDSEFGELKGHIDRIVALADYNDKSLLRGFGNEVDAQSTALTDAANTGVHQITQRTAQAGEYTFIDQVQDNSITLGNGVTTQTISFGSQTVDGWAVGLRSEVDSGKTLVANFDRLGIKVTLAGDQVEDAAGSYSDGNLNGKTIIIKEGTGGTFQLGNDSIPSDQLEYDIPDLTSAGQVLDLSFISIGTQDSARASLAKIDQAINEMGSVRGKVGALTNRLTHTLDFTANTIASVNASEATIRDTDYAWETAKLAKNEILKQATAAVFGMSQTSSDIALSLLQF